MGCGGRAGLVRWLSALVPSTYTPNPTRVPRAPGGSAARPVKSMQRRSLPFGTIVAFGCLSAAAGTPPTAAPARPHPGVEARAAAERGWFGRAEELSRGAGEAGGSGRGADEDRSGDWRERLKTAQREILRVRADREAGAGRGWEAEVQSPLWRRDFTAAASAAIEPVISADGLVLWGGGRAVHALRLRDGRAPWATGAADADATLFPRGMAAAEAAAMPGSAPAVVAGRAYCMLASGGRLRRLACLDLSSAAEGRLAWIVDADSLLPTDAATTADWAPAFDGPPAADPELCLVVVRSGPPREELALAALDARDGSPSWIARVGPARSVDGLDHARGRRHACFAEDRVVLATHAGAIHAFARDGRPAWRTPVPAVGAPAPAASPTPAPAAVCAGDRVVVAPRESRGVVALEPRRGAVAWRSLEAAGVIDVVAPAAGGVVVMSRSESGAARIVRLDLDTGRTTASHEAAGLSLGRGIVASGSVFLPVLGSRGAADAAMPVIEVLDAMTLAARRPPLIPFSAAGGGKPMPTPDADAVHLAAAGDWLVVAAGATIECLQAARGRGANGAAGTGSTSR
jgi:outer membrane protein assembly factor BamB